MPILELRWDRIEEIENYSLLIMWETLVVTILALFPSLVHCQMPQNYNRQGWKMAGEYLSQYMDRTVSPCKDVASFMCSTFGNSSNSEYQTYRDEKTSRLVDSLVIAVQSIQMNSSTPEYARIIQRFYSECTATPDDPSTSIQAYQVLKEALGEFPPFEDPQNSTRSDNIWYLMGRMQQLLNQYLIIQPNIDKSILTLSMETASQQFPREYFRNHSEVMARGTNRKVDETYLDLILDEAEALYEDWKQNGSIPNMSKMNGRIQMAINIKNISIRVPGIDWDSYFRGLFPQDFYEKWTRNELSHVTIEHPMIMSQIGNIFNRHPARAVRMLMYGKAWQTIMKDFEFTSSVIFGDELPSDLLAETMARTLPSRPRQCAAAMMETMPAAAARVYFDFIGEDILQWRNELLLIGVKIFSAMRILLNNVTYLSPSSKERINQKLDAITLNPTIPSWIMDDKKVLQSQHVYKASRSLFMDYVMNLRETFSSELQQIVNGPEKIMAREVPLKKEQQEPPPTFQQNSYFSPEELKITIQLGYILPPTFSLNYPLSLKYGHLGALIGHELNHAFDSEGVKSGLNGGILLEKGEQEIYDRQANCLINQYSQNLTQCISGTKALQDIIADIGGLKAAYGAYVMAKGVLGDEPSIPGLQEYSHDQIFFMTYQRWYCTRNAPPEFWTSADHTPDASRGPVTLKNDPHFLAAFTCPVGSPCHMWGDSMDSTKASK